MKPDVVSFQGVNVKPGSFKFKNIDGSTDNVVNEYDKTIISHSSPRFFGGIGNNFKYKGLELSVFLNGQYGNEVFNESRYRLEGGAPLAYLNLTKDFWENRWTPENPTNRYGTFSVDTENTTASQVSSYYVEDASFLRLKTVTIGYRFPKKKLIWGVSDLKIYVTADNLYTWTKYSGFDPEVDSNVFLLQGFDRISYPRSRSAIAGVNITF
ncbi:MAG: hypothetical protein LBR67_11125 [Dysgonamonadaceae bacterium]|nr:hypothetical protein [Dysgonamonadaceae bacterium]